MKGAAPATTSPSSTTPGTSSPAAPSSGTTPGSTTPGSGTAPGGSSPGTPSGGTTPGGSSPGTGTTPGGSAGPGTTPSQPAADPFLTLLEGLFDAIHQFVATEYPDAPPEFQDWLTGAVMDYYFGDLISEYLFGGSAGFGAGSRGR